MSQGCKTQPLICFWVFLSFLFMIRDCRCFLLAACSGWAGAPFSGTLPLKAFTPTHCISTVHRERAWYSNSQGRLRLAPNVFDQEHDCAFGNIAGATPWGGVFREFLSLGCTVWDGITLPGQVWPSRGLGPSRGLSLFTMFQVLTGESWSEAVARHLNLRSMFSPARRAPLLGWQLRIFTDDITRTIGTTVYFISFQPSICKRQSFL